jgi:hypothetical protein
MLCHLAASVGLVLVFTPFVVAATDLPFWLPLCVLSFNWIGEPLLARRVPSLAPSPLSDTEELRRRAWVVLMLVTMKGLSELLGEST